MDRLLRLVRGRSVLVFVIIPLLIVNVVVIVWQAYWPPRLAFGVLSVLLALFLDRSIVKVHALLQRARREKSNVAPRDLWFPCHALVVVASLVLIDPSQIAVTAVVFISLVFSHTWALWLSSRQATLFAEALHAGRMERQCRFVEQWTFWAMVLSPPAVPLILCAVGWIHFPVVALLWIVQVLLWGEIADRLRGLANTCH